MSDSSTPKPDYASTFIEESSDPESRYDKLYTALMSDPALHTEHAILYGVMRGLARKSGVVNAKNAYLAEATGYSESTVKRCLKELLDRKLVVCKYRRHENGTDRKCSFPPLSTVYKKIRTDHTDPCPTGHTDPCPTGQADLQTIRSTKSSNNLPPPTPSNQKAPDEEEENEIWNIPGRPPRMPEKKMISTGALSSAKAHEKPLETPSAKQMDTLAERDATLDSWWIDGHKIAIFEHIWSHWPKQAYREDAMGQFRASFADSFEADPKFGNALWRIVQWQLREWSKEEREPKFIPTFGNWIKRGLWRDAPEEVRG